MAMQDRKIETGQTNETRQGGGVELTHREDVAKNGDYLGRHPGDLTERNHFDEEYFIDEQEPDAEQTPSAQ